MAGQYASDHFLYVFEITERAVVENANAAELFHWLQQRGIKIAVDDFGTRAQCINLS
ncbi:EAL domain-containing protein [Pantoea ananatis]